MDKQNETDVLLRNNCRSFAIDTQTPKSHGAYATAQQEHDRRNSLSWETEVAQKKSELFYDVLVCSSWENTRKKDARNSDFVRKKSNGADVLFGLTNGVAAQTRENSKCMIQREYATDSA